MSFSDSRTTILLIDNNDEERIHYARQLTSNSPDWIILEAKDGRSGLTLCQTHHVDCIVTDFSLPDMLMIQVLFQVNPPEHKPRMPLIVLARVAHLGVPDLLKRYGAHSFLIKNATSGKELIQAIKKAIAAVGSIRNDRPSMEG